MTKGTSRTGSPARTLTLFAAGAIALLGLGAIGTVGAIQAQGMLGENWHRGCPEFGGWGIERALGAAEITPDQRDEIASILDLAQTKVGPLAGEISGFREQVAVLIAADVVDRAAFETLRKEALTALDVFSEQVWTPSSTLPRC